MCVVLHQESIVVGLCITETLPENCIGIHDDQGPFDPRLGLGSLRVGASGAHLVSQDTTLCRADPWVMHRLC